MKPARKKIVSLFFMMLGLAPLLYIAIISVKKHEIRHRMKDKMEKHALQTIILPEAEVIWMDQHEIWVNEHMFDIYSKKLENGIYTFTGLYDDDETILVLNEKKGMEKNKEGNKILTQLFKCIHTIFYHQPDATYSFALRFVHNSALIPGEAVAQFREILTPPPQNGC